MWWAELPRLPTLRPSSRLPVNPLPTKLGSVTKAVQAFVATYGRLLLVYLPPNAPELNPIELVWAYVKQNGLGYSCARSLSILKEKIVVVAAR